MTTTKITPEVLISALDLASTCTPSALAAQSYWSAARELERAAEYDRVALQTLSELARWADDGGKS